MFRPHCSLGIAALLAMPCAIAQVESALPAVQTAGSVKYVPGGIGKDESQAMLSESKRYPLSLVFSGGKENHYVANVEVRVRDGAGKTVLETRVNGPIVLVDLPAGAYVVDAQYRDRKLTQKIEVSPKRAKRVDFHWPATE